MLMGFKCQFVEGIADFWEHVEVIVAVFDGLKEESSSLLRVWLVLTVNELIETLVASGGYWVVEGAAPSGF